jgi:hypothetical protein
VLRILLLPHYSAHQRNESAKATKRVSHGLLTSKLRTLDILIATARQVPNRSSPMTGSHSTLTWDIAAMSAARSAHSARRLRRQEGDCGAPCEHVRTDPNSASGILTQIIELGWKTLGVSLEEFQRALPRATGESVAPNLCRAKPSCGWTGSGAL